MSLFLLDRAIHSKQKRASRLAYPLSRSWHRSPHPCIDDREGGRASACSCVVMMASGSTSTPSASVTPTTSAPGRMVTSLPTVDRNRMASSPIVRSSPTVKGP